MYQPGMPYSRPKTPKPILHRLTDCAPLARERVKPAEGLVQLQWEALGVERLAAQVAV
jgi:hypothetical protein